MNEALFNLSAYTTLAVLVAVILTSWPSKRRNGIPGPKGLPIFGSLFTLAGTKSAIHLFDAWAKLYGPLVRFSIGNADFILISDAFIAKDVMSTTAPTNGRPTISTYDALKADDKLIVLWQPAHGEFKLWRQLLGKGLSKAANRYGPDSAADHYTRLLCMELPKGGDKLQYWLQRFACANMIELSYGKACRMSKTEFKDSPNLHKLHRGFRIFFELLDFPANITVYLPFLRWPLARNQKRLNSFAKKADDIFEEIYSEGAACHSKDEESLLSMLIDYDTRNTPLDRLARAAGVPIPAGTGGITDTLHSAILLLVAYPAYQVNLRAELDRIMSESDSKLPLKQDEILFPYVRAIIKESLRFAPSQPFGIPHVCEETFTYEGLTINRGDTIISNIHAMQRDANRYHDPDTFNPERFIHASAPCSKQLNLGHRDVYAFGFGKRICQGADIAEDIIGLALARIFYIFEIEFAGNQHGPDAVKFQMEGFSQQLSAPDLVFRRRHEYIFGHE